MSDYPTEPTAERAAFVQTRLDATAASGKGERLAEINARHVPVIGRRMQAVVNRRNQPQSAMMRALFDAVEALAREGGKMGACRKGCAHCCHIAVTVNQAEAELIRRATGI